MQSLHRGKEGRKKERKEGRKEGNKHKLFTSVASFSSVG
jgi:hypothetical protein